jgi:hypothetical protein
LKKADREHADIDASSVRVAAEEHPVLIGVVELAWAVAFLLFPLPCHLPKQNSVRQMGPRSVSSWRRSIGLGGRPDRIASKNFAPIWASRIVAATFPYLSPNRESRSAAPNAAYPAPVHLYPLIYSSTHLHDCADEMIGRAIDACFGSPKRTFACPHDAGKAETQSR